MEILKLRIVGQSALLMHADILANPLHPLTRDHRKLTGKQKKTEDDHLAIAYSEYCASLYIDKQSGLIIPGRCLDACFLNSAKLRKLGRQWQRGAVVMDESLQLEYEGPKTADKLWRNIDFVDVRGVKVGGKKIMRYRPIIQPPWAAACALAYDPEVLDRDDVIRIAEDAGRFIGLLDLRPRMGRFTVEVRNGESK